METNININTNVNLKKGIKSEYILKIILYNLDEKKKLYLVRYNKFYTRLLGITTEQYKNLSGRIKIGGINGYGKEYELKYMHLIFKGFYLNGKRHGKGKEYDVGNGYYGRDHLIFEGEYLKGKKNGRGIEYNDEGRVIFEGEYLDGKRWDGILCINNSTFEIKDGKGKIEEYNERGNLIFKGEYFNGIKRGKEYNDNGNCIFEGEYLNEKRWNGKVKEYNDQSIFSSIITCSGLGRNYYEKKKFEHRLKFKEIKEKTKGFNNILLYEGEYFEGERNGKGIVYDIDGKILFKGEYIKGEINEDYKEYYQNKSNNILTFEGSLLKGERNGFGKEYNAYNGKLIFEGEYKNGIRCDGKEYISNNRRINESEYLNQRKNGNVKEYDSKGNLEFEGEYFNGKKWNGNVKEYISKEYIIFEGKYLNGEKHGEGKEFDKYGILLFEGNYFIGERHDKGKEYYDNKKIKFEGEYLYGLKWNGIMYSYDNNYMFEIKNGNGEVKEYDLDGNFVFEGEYIKCERGKGKEFKNGKLIFEGEFVNGKKWNGNIKDYFMGELFEGKLLRGERNGKGKEYDYFGGINI